MEGRNPSERENKKRFEVWYYYGSLTRDEIVAAKAIGSDGIPEDKDEVFAVVTLVNDTVIKADINPLESGKFPYHAMPWSRRAGHWAGVGIGEQIDGPQRMANAATRALLNNAGKSSGTQIVVDQTAITPADGSWVLTPDKIWYLNPDAAITDVRQAFMSVEIQNVGAQLMSVIEYAFKLAEEACNIPLITQGINNQNTPDTFGATQIQDSNANTLLRSIGAMFDDYVTDPEVRGYYEWLLLDPEVPDEEKAEFHIEAHGSAALVERAIQIQTLQQVGQMVLNPAFGVDPRKWFAEMMRSQTLDPRKIQYTEEEQEELQKNQAPPLPIAVAQLKAQSDQQLLSAKLQGEMQMSQAEMEREQQALQNGQASPHMAMASARIAEARIHAASAETIEASRSQAELAYARTEQEMAQQNAAAKQQEMRDQRDMLILKYSLQNNLTLEQVKADLAKTSMQEQTKRQLSASELQLQANQNAEDRNHDMAKHVSSLIVDAQGRQMQQVAPQ